MAMHNISDDVSSTNAKYVCFNLRIFVYFIEKGCSCGLEWSGVAERSSALDSSSGVARM